MSGGEPLLQPEFCQALISLCHSAGIHCAVDTAGSIPLDFCRQAVDAADLLLLDIKALDPTLCQELTGQDNQNALALLEYCEAAQKSGLDSPCIGSRPYLAAGAAGKFS